MTEQIFDKSQKVLVTPRIFFQHIGFIKTTISTAVHQGVVGDIYCELQNSSNLKTFPALSGTSRHRLQPHSSSYIGVRPI